MDTSDFEFPPDLVDDDLRTQPPLSVMPLSALVNTPVEDLPLTQPPGTTVARSLRQAIRGVGYASLQKRSRGEGPSGALTMSGRRKVSAGSSTRSGIHGAVGANCGPMGLLDSGSGDGGAGWDDEFALELQPIGGDAVGLHASHRDGGVQDPSQQKLSSHSPAEVAPPLSAAGRLGGVRRSRSEWTEEEVRHFYEALSQYGTDFAAIAVLFPEHTREEIKRLYHRELRRHQAQVRQALHSKQAIDLDRFNALLEEREKKERVPTKELNTEEEAMLSRIAMGAASLSPPAEMAEEGEREREREGKEGEESDQSKRKAAVAKKKPPPRPHEEPPSPTEREAPPDGAAKEHRTDKKPRKEPKSKAKASESGSGSGEETFLEVALRLQKAQDCSFAEAALSGSYGEFDFDGIDVDRK